MPARFLFRSTLLKWAALSAVVYALGVLVFPQRIMIELLNGMFIGMVAAVAIVFFPLFVRSVANKQFDRVAQLTIGIVLTWLSLIISRSASIATRATGDQISSISQSHWITLAAYLAIVGGILHVTAPGMMDDKLRYNRGLLAFAFATGLLVAIATIWLQGRG